MVAEASPRCTVCGIEVRDVGTGLQHYQAGKLDRMLRDPYPHDATTEPVGDSEG